MPVVKYEAVRCPCQEADCKSGYIKPLFFGQGIMPMEAAELAAGLLNDGQRLRELIGLCGYVQDGSDVTVQLFQDECTRERFLRVGKSKLYHDGGWREVIDKAIEGEKR